MPIPDLNQEYRSTAENIHNFFDRAEEGLVIPAYQREYTWEEDNLNQLFDDLLQGVHELIDENGDNALSFLGTAILVQPEQTQYLSIVDEERTHPTNVSVVVDGQQRISTIGLLAIQITEKLKALSDLLPNEHPYSILKSQSRDTIEKLTKLYSVEIKRDSQPPNKPKIIRQGQDKWTYSGDDNFYKSPVSRYVAHYIRQGESELAQASINDIAGTRVLTNINLIANWLSRLCGVESLDDRLVELDQQLISNYMITTDRIQRYVLSFVNDDLRNTLTGDHSSTPISAAKGTYRIILLTHYLLRRCGINRLQLSREEWGFDLFQALNATGTPLTALETFLPQIMQAESSNDIEWVETPSHESFDVIDDLFENVTSNVAKTRRTNELLRSFALIYDGHDLPDKFSVQRRWITKEYEQNRSSIDDKRSFLQHMSYIAKFFRLGWYMEDCVNYDYIPGLEEHTEGTLSSFLVQYLKDANSRMSAPILARFYGQAIRDSDLLGEFVSATQICAAFFTLWRSARSTSGLDDIYRRFFIGSESPVQVAAFNWMKSPDPISAELLREYLSEVLVEKGIGDKDGWMQASAQMLRYTEVQKICRFMLFVSGHDRVADESSPGLTKDGRQDVFPMLTRTQWRAKEHKSLEHVAPQSPPDEHGWDERIYSESKFDHIGNLLLVPSKVNSYVGNKEWRVKFLHYAHIGNRSEEAVRSLTSEAESLGIVLSKPAVNALARASFSGTIEPIVKIGIDGKWDVKMIDCRSQHIKGVVWSKLSGWLGL